MNRLSEGYERAVEKIWCPNMHIWQNMTIWALQIWSSGVSVKITCKMQFRRVGLRSIYKDKDQDKDQDKDED